jgi:hypothetical protein
MTKFQSIECELVRRAVKTPAADNEGASVRFAHFVEEMRKQVPGIEAGDVLSALKRLHLNYIVRLRKSKVPHDHGFRDYAGESDNDAVFFYSEDFRVKETPYSRPYLEKCEPSEQPPDPPKRPIGFMS